MVCFFSWGRFPCALGEDYAEILGPRVAKLQVEDKCGALEHPEQRGWSTFAPEKDVIIPGYLDPWRSKASSLREEK